MTDRNSCCSGNVHVVLTCSGASNVGQMTNEVAKRLSEDGDAKYFCLAGVGGHVSGMVASVKGADKVLVLDGCQVGCAKRCLDQADIAGYDHLVLTDLEIEKEHTFNLGAEDLEKALTAAQDKLAIPVEEVDELGE